MDNGKCFICKSNKCIIKEYDHGYMKNVKCSRCGIYVISESNIDNVVFNDIYKSTIISRWIRLNQSYNETVIDTEKIKNILENNYLPNSSEQLDNLLLYLGNAAKKPSDYIKAEAEDVSLIIGSIDETDVFYHLEHLVEKGLVTYNDELSGESPIINKSIGIVTAILTHEGWDRYYQLQNSNKDSRLAFMAMQYKNEILQKIYSEIIIQAVRDTGYEIRKLDDVNRAGLIDDKLRVEIRRSKFIISDLTDDNNGAYWEAGYAEGLSMPVIYICEEEKFKTSKSHFDTNHHLTVLWKDDEAGLKKFTDELKATIRATFPAEAKMED
jgi:hypothetical protein